MAKNVNVSSTIKLDMAALNALDLAQLNALAEAADSGLTETVTKQVMPYASGELQNSKTFLDDSGKSSGKVAIVSEGPYARRLYFHPEYNFRKGGNANAGGEWFKWLMDAKFLTNAYRVIFKRLGGL